MATLVAQWDLTEGSGTTAHDSTGNGNTGTLVNSPAWAVGGGILFVAASSQYIDLGTPSDLNFTGPFTTSGWLKSTITQSLATILTKGFDGSSEPFTFRFNSGNLELESFGPSSLNGSADFPYGSLFTDGILHLLTGTYDGTNYNVYVDGVLKATSAGTNPNSGTAKASIAAEFVTGTPQRFLDGTLIGVRAYNGALTATEVATLFAAGPPTAGTISSGVGTAAGIASAAGVGASRAASVGSAAGTSTANATGSALSKSIGTAAGVASATAVSSAGTVKTGVGTAAGIASASATGAARSAATGNANGIASVIAFAPTIASGTGRADGSASVRGISPTVVVVPVGGATWLSPAEIKRLKRQQANLEKSLEDAQTKRRIKNAERERIIREAVAGKPKEVAKPAPEARPAPEASPEPQEEPKQILAIQQPHEDFEALGRHIEAITAHLGNIKGQLAHIERQRQDEEDELLLLLAS